MSIAIRRIEISRFRGIDWFEWCPSPGINCLVGAGDTGKSTILEAIDLCLGARRTVQVTDADFHCLDTTRPISIVVTLGRLTDSLKSIDAYGPYLRGFDDSTGKVAEEPAKGHSTRPRHSCAIRAGSMTTCSSLTSVFQA
jgi:putative ATP-dependent endonuclease of OLD family